MTTATYFAFQPFTSRAGMDTVLGVRFPFNGALVGELKDRLRTQKQRHYLARPAGGWLPEARAWFVERECWPTIHALLRQWGYSVQEIPRPADVPHYEGQQCPPWSAPRPEARPALATALATVREAYPHHAVLGVLPDAPHSVMHAAYRALAKDWHPDLAGTAGHVMMQRINAAWAVVEGTAW
ncbi:MAG TPA: J domain-containing protein [Chloroflexota bacterium]|jgi:hypothetical protein